MFHILGEVGYLKKVTIKTHLPNSFVSKRFHNIPQFLQWEVVILALSFSNWLHFCLPSHLTRGRHWQYSKGCNVETPPNHDRDEIFKALDMRYIFIYMWITFQQGWINHSWVHFSDQVVAITHHLLPLKNLISMLRAILSLVIVKFLA